MAQRWTARTSEDTLLEQYWRQRGGRLYVEVPIGGAGGAGQWPEACTIRRLDGVLFQVGAERAGIFWYGEVKTDFEIDLRSLAAELIEVKPALNRGAIGQAVAGRHMFKRQYGVKPGRTTILCRTTDSALEWVCGEEGIRVEVLRDPPV